MATNDVWQLSVIGTVTETQHVHTLHFAEVVPDLIGTGLLAAWQAGALAAYRGCFGNNQLPVQLIRAQKVCGSVPLPAASEVAFASGPAAGLRTVTSQENMPSYVASLTTVKGSFGGRRYSGRFFLGGLIETDVNGNTLTSQYIAFVQAYIDALKAAFVTPTLPNWRLFSYSDLLADGDPNHTRRDPANPRNRLPDPVVAVPSQQAGSAVTNLIVSTRPTTMRSRKLGHGI